MRSTVYPPREDTFLLKHVVEELDLEGKKVLEIGCGNGVVTSAMETGGAEITAVDINENALDQTREQLQNPEKHVLKNSDLFENIEGSFDYLFFNPPYLSDEPGVGDEEKWYAGDDNIVRKVLEQVDEYLNDEGELFMVLSDRTPELDELVGTFELEEIREEKLWFEKLYVVRYK
ncbi:MAG: HemK-related putative methylase [Candidatus Nanohaloarchaea archaeon]|jgi:HemK-related putative methylase